MAYVVHFCPACGWWNSFKYWESRDGLEVYRVDRNEPRLEEFDLADDSAALEVVLSTIRRSYEDLRHVHWKVFQRLAQQMLSDRGFNTIDISRHRSSGGDLLAIGLNGQKCLVEVKHLNYRPTGIGIVRHLKGAMQDNDINCGLIVTSRYFTQDALASMAATWEAGGSEQTIVVEGLDFSDIVDWLGARENRSPQEVLLKLRDFHLNDALSEQ